MKKYHRKMKISVQTLTVEEEFIVCQDECRFITWICKVFTGIYFIKQSTVFEHMGYFTVLLTTKECKKKAILQLDERNMKRMSKYTKRLYFRLTHDIGLYIQGVRLTSFVMLRHRPK